MKVLYDTDFLISLFIVSEPNNRKARNIDTSKVNEMYMLTIVHYELATVLSRKLDQSYVLQILTKLSGAPIEYLDLSENDQEEVWKEFYSYKKKNISFIDCANLVMARKNGLKIASFDSFYPDDILLDNIRSR